MFIFKAIKCVWFTKKPISIQSKPNENKLD